jgi:signal transduction histidine kinase
MFVPLVATLILPRKLIIPVSILTILIYIPSQFLPIPDYFYLQGLIPSNQIVSVVMVILVEGVLLRQLRVEFDERLDAMHDSVRQTEIARELAEIDRQRAEEADKTKSQFLANMSHELRTPLNAIIGYSEAMLGGMAGEFTVQQKKLLGHIQHNSRRLLALINDILDLSKIESGSIELYLAPMSPRKVIHDTSESLRSLVVEKGIYLELNFSQDVPELILGDANKLQQIVVNLVSNAIKFTEMGGVKIDVSATNNNRWQFRVQDTGIGIPAGALNSIFEPFRQVDSTNTRKYKGTGLGLSITKHLVEKMEGTIEVVSEPGKGSTFTIELPRVQIPHAQQEKGQME